MIIQPEVLVSNLSLFLNQLTFFHFWNIFKFNHLPLLFIFSLELFCSMLRRCYNVVRKILYCILGLSHSSLIVFGSWIVVSDMDLDMFAFDFLHRFFLIGVVLPVFVEFREA